MNINNINSISNEAYTTSTDTTAKKSQSSTNSKNKYGEDSAAVYEKSKNAVNDKKANKALIDKLKADEENRRTQLVNLAKDMFTKQGKAFTTADDMWKMLAKGDFTVDAKTAAKAQEDISEDGYWGIEQTSQRIFDFAQALTGGDEEKMDKMLNSFKTGFEQATKAWGKELPDISQKTYDSVIKKFDDYKASLSTDEDTTTN